MEPATQAPILTAFKTKKKTVPYTAAAAGIPPGPIAHSPKYKIVASIPTREPCKKKARSEGAHHPHAEKKTEDDTPYRNSDKEYGISKYLSDRDEDNEQNHFQEECGENDTRPANVVPRSSLLVCLECDAVHAILLAK